MLRPKMRDSREKRNNSFSDAATSASSIAKLAVCFAVRVKYRAKVPGI